MNDVPSLITPRLRLRPFAPRDVQAVLELYGDRQVNTFLPWYPIDTAAQAVLDFARRDGMPYVTATHDVCNPASGRVMRRLGLCYCYSYVEQWQPKDIPVTFRLYQRSLDGAPHPAYDGYWNRYPKHFFEEI